MKKRILFDLIIIFLLGLLPLLWFPGNTMLFGHDAGFPFDPITHFLDRFSVWSQRLGIGTDQSYGLLGALPIHALQAFLVWAGFSFKTAQLLDFIFWFALPGFTMYFFAYNIWPNKKYLPLIASVVYMINYYLIQAWFVAEQTKFSIYAALPLVVYFLISYLQNKISWKKSIIGTGLVLGILNGGGSVPIYGGILIVILTTFFYVNIIFFSKDILKKTFIYSIGVTIVYAFLNAYWIFPYVYYIFGFYSRDLALAGGPEGALAWSEYLSKGSSFLNIFRGQGIPEWYLNLYHAFASEFFTNPLLIIASFVFPILAYTSLFIVREKRDKFYIYLLVLISLITIIFMAGPKSQLGIIYDFTVRHVPGFAIFRSNFYKFGYAFWFAYAILIGFTLEVLFLSIVDFFRKRRISTHLLYYILPIFFVCGYLLYHYPILDGRFLDYSHEPGKELSNRVNVPQYVFDFGKWSNQQNPTKRYLIVPELSETGFIAYQWRYWSLAPISSLQDKNSFVQNTFLVSQDERLLMKQMYNSLLRKDMKSFSDFAEVFAIDGIVVQEDFDWKNISWGTTNPALYENILENNPKFKLIKKFGSWKIYDIADRKKSLRVTATPKLNFLQGELKNVMSFPEFDPISPLFMANIDPKNTSYFAKEATDVMVAPECIQCDLKKEFFGFNYYNPKVLPGSVLYPLVLYRENKIKQRSHDFESLLNFYLTTADRRIVEAKWMVDSKEKIPFLQQAFDRYYSSILELKNFVSKRWGISGKDQNRLARTINGHLLQEVSLIDSIFESDILNIGHRKSLAQTYDDILEIKAVADKKQWVTEDITDKRYIFDLPKTGVYEVYTKKKSLSDPNGDALSSTITFADDSAIYKSLSEQNDWLYFGRINFANPQLRLAFRDSTLKNLLDNISPQFPDGTLGITRENKKFSMSVDSRNKCFTYTATNLETIGTQYLISFNYRNLTDKKDLGFFVSDVMKKNPKLRIRESELPNTRAWANHNEVVTPIKDSIKLNFCNGFVSISQKKGVNEREDLQFLSPGQNLNEIQDIAVYKISYPTIVFYQKQKDVGKKEYIADFKKTDSVTYKINVSEAKEPVTLVMRENYGKYWQLCDEEKKCLSFDDKNHFNSAGFTNGWYFKDGLRGKIQLFYFPQRTYTFGGYLSIFSLLLILGGICWTKLRKK